MKLDEPSFLSRLKGTEDRVSKLRYPLLTSRRGALDGRCKSLRLMLCVCHVIERKRRERDSNPCSLGEDSLLSSDEKNSAADSFKTFYKHYALFDQDFFKSILIE